MSDDPFERLRQGDESALADLGYEIVDDEPEEFGFEESEPDGFDWSPEPEPEFHAQAEEPEFDTQATLRDFNAHVDHLEQQTGVKMTDDERQAFIFQVLDSGPFHPSTTENLFYQRVQNHEADLLSRSRDSKLAPHEMRAARRERMARAITKANGGSPELWRR